jgi:hypothetical protein
LRTVLSGRASIRLRRRSWRRLRSRAVMSAMRRIGLEDRDVLVCRVDHVPEMGASHCVVEEPAGLDLVAEIADGVRMLRSFGLHIRKHSGVVLLHLLEDRVAVRRHHVLDLGDSQRAAVTEQRGGLLETQRRVDPVERRERDDGVEVRARRSQGLEVGIDHLDARERGQLAPRNGRELSSQFHRGDPVAALRERDRRLASAAADLQDARRIREGRERGKVVEERCRIARTGAVVQLGDLLECRPQILPGVARHARMLNYDRRGCAERPFSSSERAATSAARSAVPRSSGSA